MTFDHYPKITLATLLLACFFLFVCCDKDGNPLPSDYQVEIWQDAARFIDEVPLFGAFAKDGPQLIYHVPTEGYQTPEHIMLSTAPYKGKESRQPAFRLVFYYPTEGGIEIGKRYPVAPIAGKEIVTAEDKFNDFESGESFLRYTSNNQTISYGTGYILFTNYEKNERGSMIAEGTMEFSIPKEDGKTKSITGTFQLPVQIIE